MLHTAFLRLYIATLARHDQLVTPLNSASAPSVECRTIAEHAALNSALKAWVDKAFSNAALGERITGSTETVPPPRLPDPGFTPCP